MGATAATATLQYEHPIVRSAVRRIVRPVALTVLALTCGAAARQISPEPESLVVKSGALQLRASLFRPRGSGPFPAVLFNHGSYISAAPMEPDTAAIVGQVFARHGYALLFLFRQGIGPSIGQGTADGDLMENAFRRSIRPWDATKATATIWCSPACRRGNVTCSRSWTR